MFQSVNMDTVAMQEGGEREEVEEEEEEDPGITDIDEPTPRFTRPISTLPGTFMYVAKRRVSEASRRTWL